MNQKQHRMIDQADLMVSNMIKFSVNVLTRVKECFNCSFINQLTIKPYDHSKIVLDTRYANDIQVVTNKTKNLCLLTDQWFNDGGQYHLVVDQNSSNSSLNCTLTTLSEPDVIISPLFVASVVSIWLLVALYSFELLSPKNEPNKREDQPDQLIQEPTSHSDKSLRNKSKSSERADFIDIFRGLTIVFMIFVNYGGSGYSYFNHKPWFGITLADMVFPFFIFLMGTSIIFSIPSKVRRKESFLSIIREIFIRSLKLFFFGLMVNSISETSLGNLRILGVLQRFSISYMIVSILHLISIVKFSNLQTSTYLYHLSDLLTYWFEWIWIFIFSITYLGVTLFWKYSDTCPVGYQGPGGLHLDSKYFNCTGGAARALDILVFGTNHIYKHNSVKKIYYNTLDHDPEGLLGFLTSIVLTFFGLQAGKIFVIYKSEKHKIIHWEAWAILTMSLTCLLTLFNPICKNLWSLSFICLTGSLGFTFLASLYLACKKEITVKLLSPFISAGKNSILIYCGHELAHKILPFYFDVNEASRSWLMIRSLLPAYLWLSIAVYLDKKKMYLKV